MTLYPRKVKQTMSEQPPSFAVFHVTSPRNSIRGGRTKTVSLVQLQGTIGMLLPKMRTKIAGLCSHVKRTSSLASKQTSSNISFSTVSESKENGIKVQERSRYNYLFYSPCAMHVLYNLIKKKKKKGAQSSHARQLFNVSKVVPDKLAII